VLGRLITFGDEGGHLQAVSTETQVPQLAHRLTSIDTAPTDQARSGKPDTVASGHGDCRDNRRQASPAITHLVAELTPWVALHGFGMKKAGLVAAGHRLTSADSLAWSYGARRRNIRLPGHSHRNCASCLPYPAQWRARLLADIAAADARGHQEDLFAGRTA
jgi:hypothetical protein